MMAITNIVPADAPDLNSIDGKQHDGGRLEYSSPNLQNVPLLTPEQEKKLWRKVDMRLIPMLSVIYLLAFLDRGV